MVCEDAFHIRDMEIISYLGVLHLLRTEGVERNGPGARTRSYTTSGVLMAEACAQRVNGAVNEVAKDELS